MAANASPNPYTQVIDLTSKSQRKARRDEVGTLEAPDPPLDEATLESLPHRVEQAVYAAGWADMMEVQKKAIPYMLADRDLIVQAQTGSGKTGAFLLPLFDRIDPEKEEAQALILTPTRELARQIKEEFERMKLGTPETNQLEVALLYGGVGYGPQIEALKGGAQLVVGTPGRTLDHLKKKNFKADTVHQFILDEADEMLSMGFLPDIEEIEGYLTYDKRASHMVSATMPPKVRNAARAFLRDPGFLSLSTEQVSVSAMDYRYYLVNPMDKDRTLERLIALEEPESAIIFANTKKEVSYLQQFLSNQGIAVDEMSGDLSQRDREKAIDRLRSGETRMMVATDVAARGIDVSDLSHVFIYDVPQDHEYIIHRSGRTARAGKEGTAIILATHEDEFELERMAKAYDIELEKAELPEDPADTATALLEDRRRDSTADDETVRQFLPLVDQLAQERPELLATVIADLYEAAQAAEEEAEETAA
ncbi:DEAD/DEAH box helicase [Salisaeta longa]|uniref:DEAD/DEAH box helicase n=1 Tax=Salisaeta longa TaxID=503170 RepID=UPI0003B3F229|nr:DEAD/DEAH box helicase [Salisaeta longa]